MIAIYQNLCIIGIQVGLMSVVIGNDCTNILFVEGKQHDDNILQDANRKVM